MGNLAGNTRYLTAGLLAAAIGFSAGAADAGKVGVAAAVRPDAFSEPENGKKTQIKLGKSIFYNERINTNGEGLVQVLLVDGSTFTVGPGSDLVIDKFVYDPNKKEGEIAASFSKGVLRFVGGKISKNADSVSVKTPTGALAIRGGIFQGMIGGNKTLFSFLFGNQMVLTTSSGRTYRVYQPGYTLDLTGGKPNIRPTTGSDTALFSQQLSGRGRVVVGGQGGGAGGQNGGAGGTTGGSGQSGSQQAQNNSFNDVQVFGSLVSDATTTQLNQEIQNQENHTNNPGGGGTGGGGTGGGGGDDPFIVPVSDSKVYKGYSAAVVTSDVPEEGFVNRVMSQSPDDTVYNTSGDLDSLRVVLYDVNDDDPATTAYRFRYQQEYVEGEKVFGFDGVGVFDNDGEPYSYVSPFAGGFDEDPNPPGCGSCDFLKWGAAGAHVGFGNYGEATYIDSLDPIWVVASNDLSTRAQIDSLAVQNATATYTGKMYGTVVTHGQNGFVSNPKAGNFNMSWDFALRSGQMNMNFDHRSFGGTMKQVGQINRFKGNLAGDNLTGGAVGSFANRNGIAAGGVLGAWNVGGGNYNAAGVFGGAGNPH
ncbi:FecR domain-containing protein [Methyloligella sp. 2.7D]|uniref:FecR family protein n=1 Tax=unclassified Methyloligella TaxID=2625955 RepID=UPI00157D7818|nr:FecR domain-containing protein [Methyloligella sp. GL2]QKP77443.1 FecR domain-containing protein [Methyloligella sp. GL2]